MMKNIMVKKVLIATLAFIVYACSSIFSKFASLHDFLSLPYLFFLGLVVLMLGLYALLWQKVLSMIELNRAFLYKSSTILMILSASVFVFGENISRNNIVGALFIISGLVVLSWKK